MTFREKTKEYQKKFTRIDQEIFRAALMEDGYERYEGGIMYQGKCYYFAFPISVQASIETKANDKPHGFKDMLYSEVPGPIRLKAIELIAQGACPYEVIVGKLLPVKYVYDFLDWYSSLPADRPDLLEKISEPERNEKKEETKKEALRSM